MAVLFIDVTVVRSYVRLVGVGVGGSRLAVLNWDEQHLPTRIHSQEKGKFLARQTDRPGMTSPATVPYSYSNTVGYIDRVQLVGLLYSLFWWYTHELTTIRSFDMQPFRL